LGRRWIVPGPGRRIQPQQRLDPIVWSKHFRPTGIPYGSEDSARSRVDRHDCPALLTTSFSTTPENKRFRTAALFEAARRGDCQATPEAGPVCGVETQLLGAVTGAVSGGEIRVKLAGVGPKIGDGLSLDWRGRNRSGGRRTETKLAQLIASPQGQGGRCGKSGPEENPVHDSEVSTDLRLARRPAAGFATGTAGVSARQCRGLALGVSHPKLADGINQPSFAKATEGILPSLRERRMVGSEGIEPPTLSV
jgi:hypothetical protein